MPPPPRDTIHAAISLRWELIELRHALDGARLLLEELSTDRRPEGDPLVPRAARAARAVLAIVGSRLGQWDRLLAGDADGTVLVAPHNAIDPSAPPESDVILDLRARAKDRRSPR